MPNISNFSDSIFKILRNEGETIQNIQKISLALLKWDLEKNVPFAVLKQTEKILQK